MSIVTYRDGIMACDSFAYAGLGQTQHGYKRKIRRLPDGSLVGATADVSGGVEALLDWILCGHLPGDFPSGLSDHGFSALLVKPPMEQCLVYVWDDSEYPSGPLIGPFFAIGSGRAIALGAMWQGGNAFYGAQAAAELHPYCTMPIYIENIKENP